MKKAIALLVLAAALPLSAAEPNYVHDQLLVRISPNILAPKFHSFVEHDLISLTSAKTIRDFPNVGWKLIQLPRGTDLRTAKRRIAKYADRNAIRIETALDLIVRIPHERSKPMRRAKSAPKETIPNDEYFPQLWGMQNTGQFIDCAPGSGAPGVDIQAPAAWSVWTGDASVVVAVIDDGVDKTHPDLITNIWTNPGEIEGNGIDDDGDGVVDDVHGFDARRKTGDTDPPSPHATHCAGTAGAIGNNNIGVSGVNWTTSILSIRIADTDGTTSSSVVMAAFDYVIMMKNRGVNIRVTSNSWGNDGRGPEAYSQPQKDAIDAAGALGIVNVFAAGNYSDGNNDADPVYPASYDSPSILSVTSNAFDGTKAFNACWGAHTVDLAAPGMTILSTVPSPVLYACMTGTSMATPHVAGAAALLLSRRPQLTVAEVKELITSTVTPLPRSWQLTPTKTNGMLNLAAAMAKLEAMH